MDYGNFGTDTGVLEKKEHIGKTFHSKYLADTAAKPPGPSNAAADYSTDPQGSRGGNPAPTPPEPDHA